MATAKTATFEELTRLASDFVAGQKGTWDHTAWMDFLSHVQQQGVAISEDMESKLGDLLEATKAYQAALASTDDVEKAMSTVLNESVAFIKRQKGVWGHAEWEDFLKTTRQNTRTWSEGAEAYLGGVLESLNAFYELPSVAPVEQSAPAAPGKAPPESSSASKNRQSRKKDG